MNSQPEWLGIQSRRNFLGNAGKALALAGAASILGRGENLLASLAKENSRPLHSSPKAARVIHILMTGGPSQLDTWDPKPHLHRYFGQDLPESVRNQANLPQTAHRTRFPIAPSPFRFAQHGQSGHWISELFPHIARVADELTIVKSVHSSASDHQSAVAEISAAVSPDFGSSGNLLSPDVTDLSAEPQSTWNLYGPRAKTPGTFAHQCLLARRAAERGVRFTRIFHDGWDMHLNLPNRMQTLAAEFDRPVFALIADLRQRGLLDDTLVIWGGEFGRTVYSQASLTSKSFGRDHHSGCFPICMAGGGVKPGISYGQTDDFSHSIVQDPVHIRDLQATIAQLTGTQNFTTDATGARTIHSLIA